MKKLLALNRSEIAIRVFRAANELGIRTVAIYSHEDRFALHRFKADEAYLVGEGKGPVEAYLDVDGIVALAQREGRRRDPPRLRLPLREPRARRAPATRPGITFVGPQRRAARPARRQDRRPRARRRRPASRSSPGSDEPVTDPRQAAQASPTSSAIPLIVKAAIGGGGRGMRVVETRRRARRARSKRPAARPAPPSATPPSSSRTLHPPRQAHRGPAPRRPARQPRPPLRARLLGAAPPPEGRRDRARRQPRPGAPRRDLRRRRRSSARAAGYDNAGTVEFLVDADTGEFFFIEVNPRIQVEHTVTEMVTGIDLVRCQILIAQGHPLHGPEIDLPPQDAMPLHGYALQCRVTTEDPANNFVPDYGRISHLPLARRLRHPARRRHGLRRRGHHAVLRLAAGEGDRLRPRVSRTPASAWTARCGSSASAA